MRIPRFQLRLPLVLIAFGSLAIAHLGAELVASSAAASPATTGEFVAMSLPLTVAWFSFSGSCMMRFPTDGVPAAVASGTRFLGRAAFIAGIPVWVYWYLYPALGPF